MKRLIVVGVSLFVFSITAQAQMGGMMMGDGQQMMMKQMMMMHEMMQMMMDMMNMQEKMMMGVKPAEKNRMKNDIAHMKEKMQKMMSMCMGMMMGMDDSQTKLKCSEEWLKKAIDLHDLHIKNPKTVTPASQMELMDRMKKAYNCITGTGSEMNKTLPKDSVEGEKKKDDHGHH